MYIIFFDSHRNTVDLPIHGFSIQNKFVIAGMFSLRHSQDSFKNITQIPIESRAPLLKLWQETREHPNTFKNRISSICLKYGKKHENEFVVTLGIFSRAS